LKRRNRLAFAKSLYLERKASSQGGKRCSREKNEKGKKQFDCEGKRSTRRCKYSLGFGKKGMLPHGVREDTERNTKREKYAK